MLHNSESGVYNITFLYIFACYSFVNAHISDLVVPYLPNFRRASTSTCVSRKAQTCWGPGGPWIIHSLGIQSTCQLKRLVFSFFLNHSQLRWARIFRDWKGWGETNQLDLVNQTSHEKFWGLFPRLLSNRHYQDVCIFGGSQCKSLFPTTGKGDNPMYKCIMDSYGIFTANKSV